MKPDKTPIHTQLQQLTRVETSALSHCENLPACHCSGLWNPDFQDQWHGGEDSPGTVWGMGRSGEKQPGPFGSLLLCACAMRHGSFFSHLLCSDSQKQVSRGLMSIYHVCVCGGGAVKRRERKPCLWSQEYRELGPSCGVLNHSLWYVIHGVCDPFQRKKVSSG